MNDAPISAAFAEIVLLAGRLGIANINEMDGCWEHQIDDNWWVALNGHDVATDSSKGNDVPPFSAYISFNDFPAGVIGPYDGVIAAGAAANEGVFIEALKQASLSATENDQ